LSLTTPRRKGSSSTTSRPPHVRVPRHVARLVVDNSSSRRLVVDNSASRRLVVDYFASAARSGASARREARHADRRVTRRRLLLLRRVSGCLGTSRGSSLVVDYFAYSTRPSASSARRVAHHRARRAACRRLLRLRRASGCLGTSRGSSRRSSSTTPRRVGSSRRLSLTTPPREGSSSTTSRPPHVRVPWHVARLVVDNSASRRLVVDYFASAARPGASARHEAHHADRRATRRRLLRLRRVSGCLGTWRGS
jgi:hypothetical protein